MPAIRRLHFGVFLVLFGLILPVLLAQPQPMTIVDMLEIPRLTDPELSPDGSRAVFVLRESDWDENRQIPHIWTVNLDGTDQRQLTYGEKGETNPTWSPDGRWIAFLAERPPAKERQVYLLPMAGGEARQLTAHPTNVASISWSADGSSIYFLASEPKSEEREKREKLKDDIFPFDEDYRHRHLWRVSVADGESERITEGEYSIRGYELSRDGSLIVLHRAPSPLIDDSDESEVWVMKADGSQPVRLTQNMIAEAQARLSPDGSQVLFLAGSNANFETYFNRNLFLVDSSGDDSAAPVLPNFPYEIQRAAWSAEGSAIYFAANMGVESQLFRLDLDTKAYQRLSQGNHAIRSWHYLPDRDQHLISLDRPDNPGDLWTLASYGQELKRVSHVFDYLSEKFLLPRQERVEWKGEDGERVEGLLFYPIDFQPGRRYPLVVQTHGGPASSDKFGFGASTSRYNPVLAAHGYLVLKPNYRGSTGYGNDFLRDMVGHYFNQAHLDVMAGVDYLIQRGLADPERMVKMGWSAGGHMTNKIITFTDRFKAASSGAGAVNWISMYGQSDVRIYRTPWFGGTPWQENAPIEVYWENSPLKDIHRVSTPTLVLVGENDVRVPPPQSVELHRALKFNGVPTRLYIAPREPHGWRELRHQLFKINVELDWYARHALGKDYQWETVEKKKEEERELQPTG